MRQEIPRFAIGKRDDNLYETASTQINRGNVMSRIDPWVPAEDAVLARAIADKCDQSGIATAVNIVSPFQRSPRACMHRAARLGLTAVRKKVKRQPKFTPDIRHSSPRPSEKPMDDCEQVRFWLRAKDSHARFCDAMAAAGVPFHQSNVPCTDRPIIAPVSSDVGLRSANGWVI